ncbi:hypothetical protein FRC06_010270, partial [Ceratobasidium sp. 370]
MLQSVVKATGVRVGISGEIAPALDGPVTRIVNSPRGYNIIGGAAGASSCPGTVDTGQPVDETVKSGVKSVAYSPNGAYVVSDFSDKTVRIRDAHNGQPVGQPLVGHTSWVFSVAYSPEGANVASGSWDGTVRIWDAHGGQPVGLILAWYNSQGMRK